MTVQLHRKLKRSYKLLNFIIFIFAFERHHFPARFCRIELEQWFEPYIHIPVLQKFIVKILFGKIRIKRQLTNNINHELKTPVASMQVCLETLLSGISLTEEKRQELIERCYANAERLRRLLGDVSLITRMEDGSALIAKQPVCLNDIINEVAAEVAVMPADERMESAFTGAEFLSEEIMP